MRALQRTLTIIVAEMVGLLNVEGQKQTHRSTRQIERTNLTKFSVIQIIHCIFGRKCKIFLPTCLLFIIVSFSCFCCIHISQGSVLSVLTQLTCSGIFNAHFIVNYLHNASVKEF